ncbi:MAG: tRNA (cytidine(56)-2'-O)-methyltransferase [Candidatus Micrarchaeota archaeon]
MSITVLRIGHRRTRDARISTHCGLVARAFGAERIVYTGESDDKLLDSVRKVADRWGGPFEAEYEKSWKKVVSGFDGVVTHLTMYGIPIQTCEAAIKNELNWDGKAGGKRKNLLVAVGGEKVPGEMYQMAGYNVAVTSQPHSEIAALAIFLDRMQAGSELDREFSGAKQKIIPQERGKMVEENK